MIGSLRRLAFEPIAPVRRRLRERALEISRDLRMIRGSLFGEHPPPFRERHGANQTRRDGLEARIVSVDDIIAETPDCVSLVLRDCTGAPFKFAAGQFFTIVIRVEGKEYRRAYSASSAPTVTDAVTISVKRVEGGFVSNFIHDRFVRGMRLELLGPSGDFVVEPGTSPRTFLMIAGGSGITPIASILQSTLLVDEVTNFVLIYGSRSREHVIFKAQIDALARAFPTRLRVTYALAEGESSDGIHIGILDHEGLSAILDRAGIALNEVEGCYVCGPEPMMDAARHCLVERGLSEERMTFERFVAPHPPAVDARANEPHAVTIRSKSKGQSLKMVVAPGQTLLDAAVGAGVALPFSCTMGGCGACKVKKLTGDIVMAEPNCLTPKEREEGQVLACVSCVLSDVDVEIG